MSGKKEVAGSDLDGLIVYRGDEDQKVLKKKEKEEKIKPEELEELKKEMKEARNEKPEFYEYVDDYKASVSNNLIIGVSFIIIVVLFGCFIFAVISLLIK